MQLDTQRIKALRHQHGWTQQQLADICGLSLRTVQRVEVQGIASLETSKALAAAFSVERESLYEVMAPALSRTSVLNSSRHFWLPLGTFVIGLLLGFILR